MADENLGSSYLQQNRQSEARRAGDSLLSELGLDPMGQPMQQQQGAPAPGLGPVNFENISPQDRAMIEQRLGVQVGQPQAQPGQPVPTSAAEHAAGAAGRIRKIRSEQAKEQKPSFVKDVIGGTIGEVGRSVGGGVRDAVKEMLESADSLASWVNEKTGTKGGLFGKMAEGVPDVAENQTPGGKLLRGIAQFATGYATGGKVLGAAGVAGKVSKPLLAGAFADVTAFDPEDPNISNIIKEQAPELVAPLGEFLATKPGDNEAVNRFKRGIEGLAVGKTADLIVDFAKGLRANRAVKQVEGAFEQAKAVPTPQVAERPLAAPLTKELRATDDIAANMAREENAARVLQGNPTLKAAQEAVTIRQELQGNATLRAAQETILRGESEEQIVNQLVKQAKPELEAVAKEVFTSVKEPESVSRATVEELQRGLREEAPVGIPKPPAKYTGEKRLTPHEQEIEAAQKAARGEAGEISQDMLYTIARAAVGGAIGLSQGETMEDRITNAVMGAGAGAALKPALIKKLIGAVERVAPREAKVIKSFDPPTLDVTKRGVTRRPPKEVGPVQVASKEDAKAFLETNPDAIEIGDKAIKVQWDEVNSQAEFDRVTKTLVSLHEAEIDVARRGKISDEASKKLAEMLGTTEEDMLRRRRGQALNEEQARAFTSLYASSAKKLDDLATRMKAGENVENQLRLHLGRTTALLEQVYGARAEWGRAGRAWQGQGQLLREGQSLSQQIDMLSLGGKSIADVPAERLADMILALNSPAQKATFLSHATKMGQSAVLEAWMNGLLSNPATHVANIASNATTTFMGIAERAIASQFGKEVARGEATAMMHGVTGGWREALDIARRTFTEGESALGFSKMENVQRAITAENFGATGQMGRAVDMLGSVVSTPGRALMAADDFFKAINYRAELNAQAWRQASREGLNGNALKKRAADLASDVDFASLVKDQAEGYAFYQTFNQELGRLGEGYIDFLGKHPWARVITPFVRTPINIAKYTLERTPFVNLLMNQTRADIAAGGIKRELALAKMGMGGMIFGTAASLAMGDYITGGGPKDETLRKMKRDTGWQPYSIKVGDQYISYSRLDPFGFIFGIGGDFVEKAGEMDDLNLGNLSAAAVVAMQDTFLNKTYMQGLLNAFKLIESGTWSGKAEQFVERLAGSVVPAGIAQLTKQLDPTMKEVNGAADAIFARLPGFSQDIPPRRNLWGETIMLEGGVGPDLISPFYTSMQKDDPVTNELLRLELPIKMPNNYIFGSRPTDSPFANEDPRRGVRLLPEEYDRYVQLAGNELKLGGKGLHDKLAEVIDSPVYQGQSELAKKTLIQRYVNIYRDAAEAELMSDREFPELKEEIRAKLEERREALRPGQ